MPESQKTAAKKVAPKKAAPKKPTAEKKVATHSITVKRDGFRRCDRAWNGTTKIFKGDLKPAEIKTLKADPMFVVEEL